MLIKTYDVESTGIPSDADKHAIVELGWCDVDVRDNGSTFVNAPDSVLCNPGRPIPFEAMAVHHITEAMVEGAVGDVSYLGEADYFAAHNADFEQQFFKPAVPVICTWKVALRLWPDLPSHKLQVLRYALGLQTKGLFAEPPHRAGPDAYVCALLLERITQEKRCTIEDMVRWSSGPALLPRCPLFKHRGKKWEDVPTDYLNFVVYKAKDVDPNVMANAKHHLKKREAA